MLLAAVTPPRWLAAGIVLMACADAALVVSELLQHPNEVLNAAHPAAGLPKLQAAVFGSAAMGYGDLFVAGLLGGLLARGWPSGGRSLRARQVRVGGACSGSRLAFDLLFFAVERAARNRAGGARPDPRGARAGTRRPGFGLGARSGLVVVGEEGVTARGVPV